MAGDVGVGPSLPGEARGRDVASGFLELLLRDRVATEGAGRQITPFRGKASEYTLQVTGFTLQVWTGGCVHLDSSDGLFSVLWSWGR
jgi:hypothetical protein